MKSSTFAAAAVLFALSCSAQFIGPSIEIRARSSETVTGPQAADISASTTHIANSAIHLTDAQASKIADALTGETDAIALAALAHYATTAGVSRIMIDTNTWYTFSTGTATLWKVSYGIPWRVKVDPGDWYETAVPFPVASQNTRWDIIGRDEDLYLRDPWSSGDVPCFSIGDPSGNPYYAYYGSMPLDKPFDFDVFHLWPTLSTNHTVFAIPTSDQIAAWNAKLDATNGVASHLTILDDLTLGGVTRSTWPEGGTGATAFSALVPGTSTVVWSNNSDIVRFASGSVVSLFTNDLALLSFYGASVARKEVWYDAQTTQALYVTWATNIIWDSTPNLTVTGCYHFAFETSDGIVIHGRQTYPEKTEWRIVPKSVASGGVLSPVTSELGASQEIGPVTDATTNSVYLWPLTKDCCPILFVWGARVDGGGIPRVGISTQQPIGFGGAANYVWTDMFQRDPAYTDQLMSGYLILSDISRRADGLPTDNIGGWLTMSITWSSGTISSFRLGNVAMRKLNALERAAFCAGAFPDAFRLQ